MSEFNDWSEVEIAEVQQKSKLITCKNIQPLKILNPGAYNKSSHVVLSSYGGGMVSGDQIKLKITCGANTRLFISSQSNTKIFKSVNGGVAEQVIEGELEEKGLAVIFPDPVVLQESSNYKQVQHWNTKPDSLLLVVDWFHSGRMDMGEKFVFDSFHSELKVSVNNKVVLLDRFSFKPKENIATSPANFDQYQTMLSAYLVGTPNDEKFIHLANKLMQLKMQESSSLNFNMVEKDMVLSVSKVKDGVYILRAMAKTRLDLQPVCEEIMRILASDLYLGYNPVKRKF
ncbi:urease accessory protein UreD [Pontibacter silvestris]|uniref:Urease accessory protein UreD n=1 Tax=Pontibacter silvestris TaxID=2305183 RepID=A0ABW4WTI8_9BACT|nr:urease accessory protein UreD [Pontibacter silvestris]MCC9138627.1 urease accessory protein UreD [Pontibacter silvestris]